MLVSVVVTCVRISEGVCAFDYLAAIAEMYERLKYALINRETERVREYLETIESWRVGNEEERKAYRAFMKLEYGELYREARRFLQE